MYVCVYTASDPVVPLVCDRHMNSVEMKKGTEKSPLRIWRMIGIGGIVFFSIIWCVLECRWLDEEESARHLETGLEEAGVEKKERGKRERTRKRETEMKRDNRDKERNKQRERKRKREREKIKERENEKTTGKASKKSNKTIRESSRQRENFKKIVTK